MIIENVAASFPARKISNEEVVDLVGFHSKDFDGDLHKTLRVVKTLLDRSGLITRNWQAEGERPIDHVANAVRTALQGTDLQPRDIDLFIYVGIGGGFREPANSYMMAKSLGIVRAECFDVIDACMSWTRAVSLVDSLFKTGQYRNAMVVNAEFNMTEGGRYFPLSRSRGTSNWSMCCPPTRLGKPPQPPCCCRIDRRISVLTSIPSRSSQTYAPFRWRVLRGFAS